MISKSDEKKVRIWLTVAVVIVVFVFAVVFFQFPDDIDPKFIVEIDSENYATIMGYTGNVKKLEITPKVTLDGKEYEVRYIAADAFSSHYSLLEEVIIPDTVVAIGENAFSDLPELEKVELSKNLKTIGRAAFARCPKLKKIELPATLNTIDDEAFYGCIRLSRLYIPASVTTIGNDAFAACESLLLDVSDNEIAAEVALEYSIETGKVDKTTLYIVIILAVSVILFAGVVILLHHFHAKGVGKAKKCAEESSPVSPEVPIEETTEVLEETHE